jgi:hypothetical protein
MYSDLERYLEEIAYLRSLPADANVRDEIMTRESGPETPEERLGTIESIFGQEGWRFPEDKALKEIEDSFDQFMTGLATRLINK